MSFIFVLFYFQVQVTKRSDHLAIQLHEGAITISYSVGQETLETTIGGNLNDGVQHKVSVSIVNLQAAVSVDDGQCLVEPCAASMTPTADNGDLELNGPLFVGGVGPVVTPYILSKLKTVDNFIGCLEVCISRFDFLFACYRITLFFSSSIICTKGRTFCI